MPLRPAPAPAERLHPGRYGLPGLFYTVQKQNQIGLLRRRPVLLVELADHFVGRRRQATQDVYQQQPQPPGLRAGLVGLVDQLRADQLGVGLEIEVEIL